MDHGSFTASETVVAATTTATTATHPAQRILDTAYRILGNPIVLIDTSYNLLARTENTSTDDALWNELISGGRFSHETVDFFNTAGFIQAVAGSEVVSLLHSEALAYDRACAKFFDSGGIQLGSIVVVACYRPFEPADFDNMILTCELISADIRRDVFSMTENVFCDATLDALLACSGDLENAGVLTLRAELKPYIYVAVADVSVYEHTLSHLAYFRDVFSRLQKEYKYYIHLNNIVILLGTDRDLLSAERDLKQLGIFFARYHVFVGVSGAFLNLSEFRAHYKQALDALNHGMSQSGGAHIFKYDTFRADCFFNSAKDAVMLGELCNPIAARICDDDRELGTRNFETLRAYLTCGKSAAKTCRQTNLSPGELRAWLHAMKRGYDIDWNDGNLLFSLLASCKIMDCL
jgi:hypothetical protein